MRPGAGRREEVFSRQSLRPAMELEARRSALWARFATPEAFFAELFGTPSGALWMEECGALLESRVD